MAQPLFFPFSHDELREIFGQLGYDCRDDTAMRDVAYYDRRTSHGSTLSFVTHAGVLAALDPESLWERFLVALRSDADGIQGGTTKQGSQVRDDVLYFDPRLPSQLDGLSFPIQFRETPILVTVTGEHLTLAVHPESVSRAVGPDSRATFANCAPATGLCSGSAQVLRPPGHRAATERKMHADIPGSNLRRRRGIGRLAARDGVARVTARADGVGLEGHPRPHDVVAGGVHIPRL